MQRPSAVSHSFTSPSSVAERTRCPSAEYATEKIQSVCPSNMCTRAPDDTCQMQAVLSSDPDATCAPSGEKATLLTQSVCPSNDCSSVREAVSQILTWLSSPPLAKQLPSEENATEYIRLPPCPTNISREGAQCDGAP